MPHGSYEKAVEYFTRLREIDPTFIRGLYYLGESHRKLGDMAKAREAWEAAVADSDPEFLFRDRRHVDLAKKALEKFEG